MNTSTEYTVLVTPVKPIADQVEFSWQDVTLKFKKASNKVKLSKKGFLLLALSIYATTFWYLFVSFDEITLKHMAQISALSICGSASLRMSIRHLDSYESSQSAEPIKCNETSQTLSTVEATEKVAFSEKNKKNAATPPSLGHCGF